MSAIPNYSVNSDKRVKLLQNGTPVSNSTSPTQYARPLNFTGTGVTASPNDTLGTFDVNVPGATTNTMANVGTGTGTIYRDTTSNTYNLKTLKAGSTNITITNNADDITLDVPAQASSTGLPNPLTGRSWGWMSGLSGSTSKGSGIFEGYTYTAAGSITPSPDSTNGGYHDDTTTSTSTSNITFYGPVNLMRKGNLNFTVKCRVPDISSNRFYIGWCDSVPLPNNAFNFINNQNGFGIRFDTGQDTSTFKLLSNTGAATNTTTTTSFSIANNTVLTINLVSDESGGRWGANVNGGTMQYLTTGTPASTTAMAFVINYTTQTTAVRHFHIYDIYGESDF